MSLPISGGPFTDPAQQACLEGPRHRRAGSSAWQPSCYAYTWAAWLCAMSQGTPGLCRGQRCHRELSQPLR